jgi:hypothetical protein
MFEKIFRPAACAALLIVSCASLAHDVIDPQPPPTATSSKAREYLLHWNQVTIDATGRDHLQSAAREHIGPGRSARAVAIVHIAIFDAMNAIDGKYIGYSTVTRPAGEISMEAAIAQSAHDALVGMWPAQKAIFHRELARSLSKLPATSATANGRTLGARAASIILAKRRDDGSNHPEETMDHYHASDQPGYWRQDPISLVPIAMGSQWGHVRPFAMLKADQFRIPPPPSMTSAEYAEAYEEVQRLGGDGITTPTQRTEEQSFIGVFWAYDGLPSLCAPTRFYNQIIRTIANQKGTPAIELGRLLATANVAMADAGIASWESKYYYKFWRPVGAIRESDEGTGASGLGDGNAATQGDPTYMPLGAPASNTNGPNFTPPFPSYPSGHAAFGGALFQVLRRFYGTDGIAFTMVSDEWNGKTRDNQGNLRPLRPRSFHSLSQAEEENGQSRIYLGIHWSFDKSEGTTQGNRIGDWVYDRIYGVVKTK